MNMDIVRAFLYKYDLKKYILIIIGCYFAYIGIKDLSLVSDDLGLIFTLLISLFCFLCASICFVIAFLPGFVHAFVARLIWNPEKLKNIPEILSPIQAAINRENYNQALQIIEESIHADPDIPEVWLLKVETFQDCLGQNDKALEIIEQYFQREELTPCDTNISMLMRYTELCEDIDQSEMAVILLKHEHKKSGYSPDQQKLINNRIEYLTSRFRA
ncbi:MAG: hypothetical protein GY750_14965 [Lentisphaerae bacterium]|nr:hypothetical protein [Lentisphaerota bacterium]MCP4102701.1 hypothetical protein [Lentisphaerota bacterium]